MQMIINIEDDVVADAKTLAKHERKTLDEFVVDLVKERVERGMPLKRNGVPLIKRNPTGRTVTLEFVNELRDEDP
ncbi:hypothetical protein [Pararhizobium arenae]|uniref:hypothetical protein n=1 Tax=Pararhizobium arenae TaxID=1856850 RepID=UPI00094AF134|nr:hypothetical protein [Pararhizobium arenae]